VVSQAAKPAPRTRALLGGRYELLEKLGAGGGGDVHLAIDRRVLGRRVAIKRLPHYLRDDPTTIARFEHEVRMAARVRHPGVVTVYDLELDEEGSPFLVMEYIRGKTLAERSRAQLALPEIAAVGRRLCDALEALHHDGVVHRDVKPSNVMLSWPREGLTVKLIDFGLAVAPRAQRGGAAEAICGTPQYMAPEQIVGGPVDARTDLFSVGCLLYELFTGAPPGGCSARQLVLTRQLYTSPPPLAARGVDIPRGLEAALMRALAKEREHRPDSVAELRDQLAACEGGT